jgi:ABC-type antimicrobial peptide transport system permease subunit
MIKMIIQNLLRRKGRTAMCVSAIAISTALLVSLLSVAEGIWQSSSGSILASKEDILVKPNIPPGGGIPVIDHGHEIADDLRSDTTNISEASPMTIWWLEISPLAQPPGTGTTTSRTSKRAEQAETDITEYIPQKSGVVLSLGIIPERMKYFFSGENTYDLDIIEFKFNNWFTIPGDPHYKNNFTGPWTGELLIDEHLAKKFNLNVGSKVNLSINSAPVTFTVQGIFSTNLMGGYYEDWVDGLVILHLSELQSLLGHDLMTVENRTIVTDRVETISIALNPSRPDENSPADVAYGIQERYPLLEVLTKEEQLKELEDQTAMSNVFYTAISLVAVIIGLLFVACVMLISVYERINEIGMLRAIGISKLTIFRWVMLESVVLIILGVLVGFLPGYFGSKLLGEYLSNNIGISQELTAFSPGLIFGSFLGMLVLGSIISLIPAIRASTMRVRAAISFVR